MKPLHFSFSILVLFLLAVGTSITAQTPPLDSNNPNPKKAIQDLKEGVLIVRLPSHAKKIAAMESLLKDKTVSAPHKKNLKKQITVVKQEDQIRNQAIVEGFKTTYNFSPVLFIYDTDTEALQSGQTKGIFLNERLKVDENVDLNNRPYLFARFGKTDANTTTGVEGIIIADKNLVDLNKPFPAYVRESGLRYLMDKTFDKKSADKRNMPRLAEKLSDNLKKYFARMNG